MDSQNTLRMGTVINDGYRKTSNQRNYTQRIWDGYSSEFCETLGSDEAAWDDIRRRERMAEAMYDI